MLRILTSKNVIKAPTRKEILKLAWIPGDIIHAS